MRIQGSITALVTPFQKNGEIDYTTLEQLIEWQISNGTDGIICCGTTGEAPTLTPQECISVLSHAVGAAKGRIPIIAGTGSYCTRTTREMTKRASDAGASAALVVVPYYNRPSFSGVVYHFEETVKVGLPIICYHHPGRTGTKLSASQIATICHIPGVEGVKEASGDLDLIMEILHTVDTAVYSGDDILTLPIMVAGGVGAISIVGNLIPSVWKQLIHACVTGDIPLARQIAKKTMGICRAMVIESNPQCVKFALGILGKCNSTLRPPLSTPCDTTQTIILEALETVRAFDKTRPK